MRSTLRSTTKSLADWWLAPSSLLAIRQSVVAASSSAARASASLTWDGENSVGMCIAANDDTAGPDCNDSGSSSPRRMEGEPGSPRAARASGQGGHELKKIKNSLTVYLVGWSVDYFIGISVSSACRIRDR